MSGAFECCAGLHSLSPLSLLAPSSGSVICFGQILISAARSFCERCAFESHRIQSFACVGVGAICLLLGTCVVLVNVWNRDAPTYSAHACCLVFDKASYSPHSNS